MKKYDAPDWGGIPLNTTAEDSLYFEVLKNGVIIENIQLSQHPSLINNDKSYLLVGRQADIVDIVMENPSISRQHAALQFKKSDGSLYIYDLGSAQGTFVNKIQIPSQVYQNLNVGDTIKFGASNRMFVLMGPENLKPPEYDSVNIQILRGKLEAKAAEKERKVTKGASWGIFDEDDDYEEDPDEDTARQLLEEEGTPEDNLRRIREKGNRFVSNHEETPGQRKVVELLRVKEAKIKHLQEENRRINAKELAQDSGLTEGQMTVLERNTSLISKLAEEINELLQDKASSSFSKGSIQKRNGGSKGNNSDDEDGLYDTTRETADASLNWRLKRKNGGLKAQLRQMDVKGTGAVTHEQLVKQRQDVETKIQDMQQRMNSLQESLNILSSNEIDGNDQYLESYGDVVNQKEMQNSLNRLNREMEAEKDRLNVLDKLIVVSAPALPSLVKIKHTNSSTIISDQNLIQEVASLEKIDSNQNRVSTSHILQRKSIDTNQTTDSIVSSLSSADVSITTPQQKEETVSLNSQQSSSIVTIKKRSIQEVNRDKDTPNYVKRQSIVSISTGVPITRVLGPSLPQSTVAIPESQKLVNSSRRNMLEGGEHIWLPPSDQTGSGYTALNDKLGY